MINEIRDFLIKYDINNTSVVIANSTGVDSACLTDLLLRLKDEFNLDIVIAHVNHKKREQSEIEESFIKEFSNKNNIKCEITHLNYKIEGNFQSEARKFRYDFFYQVLEKYNSKVLFTAHHGNDNVETFFIKIIRQSPLQSFELIKPETLLNNKYYCYRPLLSFSKDEIYNYAKENNLIYYEDESNSSDDYLRNQIRHNLVNNLNLLDKDVITKINSFASKVSEVVSLVNNTCDEFINNYITYNNDIIKFSSNDFNSLNKYIKEEVLFKINKDILLSKNQVNEILKIVDSKKANIISVINTNPYLLVEKRYDDILLIKKEKDNKMDFEIIVDGDNTYKVNDSISINVAKKTLSTIPKYNELCYNMNYFPLKVRHRLNGDKICIGSGYKKVKDILIDKKVPLSRRNDILVVLNNKDEIIWIVGVYKSPITKSAQYDCVITVNEK